MTSPDDMNEWESKQRSSIVAFQAIAEIVVEYALADGSDVALETATETLRLAHGVLDDALSNIKPD